MNHRSIVPEPQPTSIGRYVLQQPIARGGMATVHAARLVAPEGVTRLVAAKRLHPQYVDDPEFLTMFHDEARIASQIHHPNVVPVLDVVREGEEVILVQEYVHGVSLSYLLKQAIGEGSPIPISIALTVVSGVLAGLHAAHEATDDLGEPLGIVHRDVSPQNVVVSVDGVPRLVDFGIAKAKTSEHHTREGFFKGKLSYMPPEQLRGERVTRVADIYAAGLMLWELVVNRRFNEGHNDPDFVRSVAAGATLSVVEALERQTTHVPPARWSLVRRLEPIIRRAMAASPEARFATAAEMAAVLAAVRPHATAAEVASWVRVSGADYLERRQQALLAGDEGSRGGHVSGSRPRVEASTVDARRSPMLEAPCTIGIPVTTGSWSERPSSLRMFVPWALSAVLLVVVGVLIGIAIGQEPVLAVSTRTPVFERSEPHAVAFGTPREAASALTVAPEIGQPVQAPIATRPPLTTPPPPAPAVVRPAAPARVANVAQKKME